jgi:hypothetical protein
MKARWWLGMLGILAGCQTAPAPDATPTASAAGSATPAGSAQPSAAAVARVVFIGQREACACTRSRIDTTWAALEQVLKQHPQIEVTTIEQDVDPEAAEPYDELKPMMVIPGIYLMDAHGKLIKMVQGELTVEQLQQALGV